MNRTYQNPPSNSMLPRPPKIIGKPEKSVMEGESVPVVIGKQKVQGKILYVGAPVVCTNIAKLNRYSDSTQAYQIKIWYAIAMGKLSLIDVIVNDKILEVNVDYLLALFNDGTGSFKPEFCYHNFLTTSQYTSWGSMNGSNWTTVNKSTTLFPLGCKYLNGLYIVIGSGSLIMTSPDLITWTVRKKTTGSGDRNDFLYSVDYMSGRYVVVGQNTDAGGTPIIYYSDDLITWSANVAPSGTGALILYAITNNGSKFVAVGTSSSSYKIVTSSTGATWTKATSSVQFKGLIYDGTNFVGCGYKSPGTDGAVATSPDGAVWTHYYPAGIAGRIAFSIVYGLLLYIVGCDNGKIYYSTGNLNNFSVVTFNINPATSKVFYAITFGKDKDDADIFISVGNGIVYSSVNGTNWTKRILDNNLRRSICYNYDYAKNSITKLKGISHLFFNDDDSAVPYDTRVVTNSDGKAPEMKFVVISDYTASVINSPMIYQPDVAETEDTFLGINPAAAIYEILTNKQWGLGLDTLHIDVDSFNHCADSFVPTDPDFKWRRYGINLTIEDITTGQDVIDKICQMTDLVLYCENDKFYLKLLYDSSASSVGSFTDDDMQDVVISRQGWRELNNVVEGEYVDASLNFQKKQLTYKNDAAIEMAEGIENRLSTDVSYFINSIVAAVRLNEVLQREAIPKLGLSCSINRKGYALRRGDIITVSNIEHDLTDVRFRINSITLGKLSDMNIKVEAIQVYEDLFDGNYKNIASAAGQVPQSDGSFLGLGGSASAVSEYYFTASEDILVENGEVLVNIFKDADGDTFVRRADASDSGVEAHGFIQTSVFTGFQVPVFFEGVIEGLTVDSGTDYFLSAADPGKLTSTPPNFSGQVVQRIGRSFSVTQIKFEPYIPIAVSNA